ncbi:MAG: PIN domain-containing protein [Burkholderiales bacterium]
MSVDFLDTSVFIYLFDDSDERKRGIARELVQAALARDDACISHQVVQEALNVATRKMAHPLALEDTHRFLRDVLMPLWRMMPSVEFYAKGLELQSQLKLSFYDALIVAGALEAGCTRLLTDDLQHGQRIEGLRFENPFKK